MQKHLAIGRGVKILDQKNRGGVQRAPPASLRIKASPLNWYYFIATLSWNTVMMLLQIMPPILHTHKWRTFCSIAKKKWPLLFCEYDVYSVFHQTDFEILCSDNVRINSCREPPLRANSGHLLHDESRWARHFEVYSVPPDICKQHKTCFVTFCRHFRRRPESRVSTTSFWNKKSIYRP